MKKNYHQLYKSLIGIGAATVCILLLMPALRIIPAGAQGTPADISRDQELEAKITAFFESLQQGGNLAAAFDRLLVQSPLNSPAALPHQTDLRNRVSEMREQFGEILHWERYDSKPIGTDVMVVRYVLKHDQYPVIWTFAFYRKPSPSPGVSNLNRWVVVGLQCDSNLFLL